jgi:NAD(P)H-flavin reductase
LEGHNEGFVPAVCKEVRASKENAVAVICGPPVMIRLPFRLFFDLGFSKQNIPHVPGNENEMRHRQMRTLQRGQ